MTVPLTSVHFFMVMKALNSGIKLNPPKKHYTDYKKKITKTKDGKQVEFTKPTNQPTNPFYVVLGRRGTRA